MTEQQPPKLDSKTLFWNRVQLIAIFVVFLAPIVGAFVYKPSKFNNYGDLYTPAPTVGELSLQGEEGVTSFARFKNADLWAFLVVAQGACNERCEQSILNTRQLRAMQGKHLERLRSVLIYSDMSDEVAADLAKKYQPVEVYKADSAELAEWAKVLPPAGVPADQLQDRFYVVDSKGLLMISYPWDAEPNRVKKDLSRLLKSRR